MLHPASIGWREMDTVETEWMASFKAKKIIYIKLSETSLCSYKHRFTFLTWNIIPS